MYDFERGAKTTGSKFYFNVGASAEAEWNAINKMIQYHISNGYKFVIPPYLVNKTTAAQAGILPRFEGDFYETKEGLLLIPTAETPMVGLHAGEILKEEDLPLRYVAFSPCFRKEAGAAGKRDKGLRRVHQFHKVELFVICKPEDSEEIHKQMVEEVCEFLDQFNMEYRTVLLSEEDRSPVSNKTWDIELEFGNEWLEVSSISNTGDNQSKVAQIRYKPKSGGKPIKCHLLNGSGVALPRFMLTWLKE
jgi:seryl-tRNA synthetase